MPTVVVGFGGAAMVVACVKASSHENRILVIISTQNPAEACYKVIQKTDKIEMAEKKASEKTGSTFTIF